MKRLLAALLVFALPLEAQNLRQLTRATATAGVNDSALVLVSDSASRTRAATMLEYKRGLARGVRFDSLRSATLVRIGTTAATRIDIDASTQEISAADAVALNISAYRSGAASSQIIFNADNSSGGFQEVARFSGANRQLIMSGGGTASLPAITFTTADPDMGLYRFGPDTLGIATGGVHSLRISGGATLTLAGGAGNFTLLCGTGNSRTCTFQSTNSSGTALTFASGSADTLKAPGKAIFSALTAASGTPNSVCIDATSKQITENAATSCVVSSLRFKRDIAPLSPVTAKRIAARLRPVTYSYKDGGREAIGLIAEDAAVADGRLVSRDAQGRPHSVNYEQVTILLLSIVQQQQKQIDSLAARVIALSRRPR